MILAFPCQCGRSFASHKQQAQHLAGKHQNASGYPAPVCPYCTMPSAFLADSAPIYGRDYGPLWACVSCAAWVGCHPGSCRPLGRIANGELRSAKSRAHASFDPLWKHGTMSRSEAYAWLAEQLGIDREDCHIGLFDVEQCARTVMVADWWRERDAA